VQEARITLSEGRFDKPAAKILTAYAAACLLYSNGQRSGVITNLRIIEFSQRQPCDYDTDKVVINCLHHKTGPQGIAHLVVTSDHEHLLVEYYKNVRQKIRALDFSHSNRFFLTTNGSLYTQVYRRIKDALSVGQLKPPRPKDYRILVATDAARELNDTDLRRVARHLCHSTETSIGSITSSATQVIPCWLIKLYRIYLIKENGLRNTSVRYLQSGHSETIHQV